MANLRWSSAANAASNWIAAPLEMRLSLQNVLIRSLVTIAAATIIRRE